MLFSDKFKEVIRDSYYRPFKDIRLEMAPSTLKRDFGLPEKEREIFLKGVSKSISDFRRSILEELIDYCKKNNVYPKHSTIHTSGKTRRRSQLDF